MNGRDESFAVSIFRKATGKKVDEIVPFTRQRERDRGEEEKGRDAACDFISWKIWILPTAI